MPLFSIGRICEARFLPILRARRTLKFQSRLFPRHWIPMRRGSSLARTEIYDGSECPLCHHELDESFFIPPRDVDTSSSPRRTVGLQALPTTETWKKMTFYKRQLPLDVCIAFSSEEGRAVFREALTDGTVESFFKLIEQFHTQDEPAFCGLASLAMVLNSLAIDPRRPWKGPWRWFSEDLLDCCEPLERVRENGIVMSKLACLARCNGAHAETHEFGEFTLEEFRQEVEQACSSGSPSIIVSYSRKAVRQTGDGHFSPIGAYNRARDMVLILDTARFKYPPHWVPLAALYHAMSLEDPATGRPRGFIKLSKAPVESLAFTLAVKGPGWHDGYRLIAHDMGGLVASTDASTLHDLLHAILLSLPAHALEFIRLRHPSADGPRTSPPTGRLGLETPETGGTTVPDLIHLAAASVPALRRPPGCPRCNGDAAKCDGGAPQSDSDSCTTSCPPLHQKAFLLQELRDMPLFSAVSSVLEAQHAAGVRHRSGEGSEENGWAVIGRGGSTTGASEGERVKSGAGRRCGDVCGEMEAERIAMLLLLCGRDVWGGVRDRGVRDEVQGMTELTHDSLSMVRTEVDYLRSQLGEVGAMGGTMSSGGTLG